MDVIATLATVDLAELQQEAELQVRTDRKYLLTLTQLDDVLAELAAGGDARVLDIAGRRRFGYASTYFDTPDLRAHGGAAHRRRRRFKVRTRTYADSGVTWLEVKTRGRRGATVKERVPHTTQPDLLDAVGLAHVRTSLASARVTGVDVGELAPVLRTRYDRTTVLLADGGRVTIDVGLHWELPDGERRDAGTVAVVETKTPPGAGRCALDRLLAARGLRPARISKYATGLALMDPAVPRNRWHRVLSGPLARG